MRATAIVKKIYLYQGTFDPFHNNHQEVCRWCLAQPDTHNLVIHVNPQTRSKDHPKQPASWETRIKLIQNTLGESPNITFASKGSFSETAEWARQKYPGTQIIQVIESDLIETIKLDPAIDAYLLVIRKEDNPDYNTLKYLNERPVYCFTQTLPSISSTKIKRALCDNDFTFVSKVVSNAAFSELKSNEEYQTIAILNRQLFFPNNVLITLFERFGHEIQFECEAKSQKLSGSKIISIISLSGEKLALCKAFLSKEDAIKEYTAYQRFKSFGINTPTIYFRIDNVLCLEVIVGQKPKTTADFEKVGIAYQYLHQRTFHNTIAYPFKKNLESICAAIQPQKLRDEIEKIYAYLLIHCKNAIPENSLTHGHADPENVLITSEGAVVFIDVANSQKSGDKARDIYQMISTIFWHALSEKDNLTPCANKIAAFLKGYGELDITPQLIFWKFYWAIRSLNSAFQHKDHAISTEIFSYVASAVETLSEEHSFLYTPRNSTFWQSKHVGSKNIFSELLAIMNDTKTVTPLALM